MPRLKAIDVIKQLYEYRGFFIDTIFQGITGFPSQATGAGTVTISAGNLSLLTEGVIDATAFAIQEADPGRHPTTLTWNKRRQLKLAIYLSSVANIEAFVGMGYYQVACCCGFFIQNSVIKGHIEDGTAVSDTAQIGTAVALPTVPMVLEVKWNPVTKKAYFYIDYVYKGSLDADMTDLVGGNEQAAEVFLQTKANASKQLMTREWLFVQEP